MGAGRYTKNLIATDDALVVSVVGAGSVGVQLSGTWTGTVTFEATVDGTNWVAIKATPIASITGATTATAVGIWQIAAGGMSAVRARFSTASSGTVVATAQVCNAGVTKYN